MSADSEPDRSSGVEELPLTDGRFFVRLGLTDRNGSTLYHQLDRAAEFFVMPQGDTGGLVRLEGRWAAETNLQPA